MKDDETTNVPSINKIGSPGKLASTNTSVLEGTVGSSKFRDQPTALFYSTTRPQSSQINHSTLNDTHGRITEGGSVRRATGVFSAART